MSLTINNLDVSSMTFRATWNGVWSAELDLMASAPTIPSGRVVIASSDGAIALSGTVIDAKSGTFGEKRHVRVLAGAAGWGKPVRAQHYHSDVGLQLRELATTTAAEVQEIVTVLLPTIVGLDFARRADVAAQIFADVGVDWWVGLDGVTRVGIRPPIVAALDLQILDCDLDAGTVSFTASSLVEPGTILIDERLGKRVVREVECSVADGSVTGTLYIADDAAALNSLSAIVDGLAALARDATKAETGRLYEYLVLEMAGDLVNLISVKPTDGVPDLLPASVWAGISGYRAKLLPDMRVLVGFRAGDPRYPFVAFYSPPEDDGWRPAELEFDAVEKVTVGAQALQVVIGAGTAPLALMTPTFAQWVAAITVAVNGLAPGSAVAPTDMASTKAVSS